MSLVLVGLSHHMASVELRERVALDGARASVLARELAAASGESVCLSTCNRTELYLSSGDDDELEARAVAALRALAEAEEAEVSAVLYRLRDDAAAIHLFRVAAGLDSMVPGEGEILGQV